MESPQTVEQHHKARLCQTFLHTQGWSEVVLTLIVQRLTEHDRVASLSQIDAQTRLEAVAQKRELLQFMAQVYKMAQEPNPFDTARLALWSTLGPPPPLVEMTVALPDADVLLPRRRPSSSGRVA